MPRVRPIVKRLVERAAARLGYRLVPEWRIPTFEYTRHLRQLFDTLGIDTVLDVGANVGRYRLLLRREVGFAGRIVSFEPVPSVYETLVQSAAGDAGWRGLQMALGDCDGELPIHVTSRSTMSSFLTRDEARLKALGYRHLLAVTDVLRSEAVPVRRLDGIFDDVVGRPDARVFLKCDTQGFDLKVIDGASGVLGSLLALQIELSFTPIYAGAPAYAVALQHLTDLGLDVAGIYPVRRDELSRIVNVDCVMVNSRHPAVADLASRIVVGRTA